MEVLRKYLWLWVICGTVFGSVLIAILFFLINKWISRSGKHRVSKLQRGFLSNVESNNYQERRPAPSVTPPLPPRTQFLIEECQSYENLAEQTDNGDYEEALTEFEQAPDEQLDYVKVENEKDLLPPPPPPCQDPDVDNDDASTEDYDDIGGEDENQDEEDYDDVG